MPDVREIHLLDAARVNVRLLAPCSNDLNGHDWAKLVFADMIVAIRCQTCGREPLDIMASWRMDQRRA